jgi:PKD repeat protein
VPGTASASTATACAGTPFTLSVAGNSSSPGITYQWQSSPASAGTFTDITGANSATYTVTNQTAATDYRLKVTCSNGGAFANTNTVSVAMAAAPTVATLPYIQSFESWQSSCYSTQLPDNNWTVMPAAGDNSWRRDDQGASANWGNDGDGTYTPASVAGSHSARFHTWNTPDGDTGTMDLHIDLSPAGNKEISFFYINEDGDDSLMVQVSSDGGLTFTTLGTLKMMSTWSPSVFTTSSTAANAIIRLLAVSDYGGTDIGVDSLRVRVPTCAAPSALAATPAANGTDASLSWTQSGTPPQWQVQYGFDGFALGTGTTQITTTAVASLTGLSIGTPYAYYVRAICGSGDTSAWAGPFSFTTNCPAAVSLPYEQNFDFFLPGCWTEAQGYLETGTVLTSATTDWYPNYYLNGVSNPAIDINLYSTGINDWLISPSIDLGTSGNTTLSFNFGVTEFFGTTPEQLGSDDSVAFVISTDNGATWSHSNIVKVFTAANTPVNTATGGQRFSIPLTGYTGIVKIGIYATEGTVNDPTDNDIFVDSLVVSGCTLPSTDTIMIGGTSPVFTFSTSNPQNVTTYHWSFGDGDTSNAASPTHTYTANGLYTVQLIVSNSCGSDTISNTVSITGINVTTVTLGNSELTLYPNPASASVTIDNKSMMHMQSVSLTNSVGAVVLHQKMNANTENIELGNLAPGIYTVLIQFDKGTAVRKLTILR